MQPNYLASLPAPGSKALTRSLAKPGTHESSRQEMIHAA